mmetsp:Transcript_48449/g.95037  ORF Transcript_48449/g.95037 Transcript_48449/m.95037 type:complete len:278 (+) Transcript_48449:624-1457(+)
MGRRGLRVLWHPAVKHHLNILTGDVVTKALPPTCQQLKHHLLVWSGLGRARQQHAAGEREQRSRLWRRRRWKGGRHRDGCIAVLQIRPLACTRTAGLRGRLWVLRLLLLRVHIPASEKVVAFASASAAAKQANILPLNVQKIIAVDAVAAGVVDTVPESDYYASYFHISRVHHILLLTFLFLLRPLQLSSSRRRKRKKRSRSRSKSGEVGVARVQSELAGQRPFLCHPPIACELYLFAICTLHWPEGVGVAAAAGVQHQRRSSEHHRRRASFVVYLE